MRATNSMKFRTTRGPVSNQFTTAPTGWGKIISVSARARFQLSECGDRGPRDRELFLGRTSPTQQSQQSATLPKIFTPRGVHTQSFCLDKMGTLRRFSITNGYPANTQSRRSDLCTQAGKLPLP